MIDDQGHEGRRIMRLARTEARALGIDYIGTEAMVLACLAEPGQILEVVLDRLCVDRTTLRERVLTHAPRGHDPVPAGQLPFTPGAKRALESSLEEAKVMQRAEIGPAHLFLGLLADEQAVGRTLRAAGIHAQTVCDQVASAYGADGSR
jgi:ATP-dependent Clp protease ATP-binding subunit ClpC